MRNTRVLVTGASGAIGVEVATRLAAEGWGVVVLLHHESTLRRNDGRAVRLAVTPSASPDAGQITWVKGDVTDPTLELEPALYQQLQTSLDLVVHLAAVVEFGRPAEVYESVNHRGTANVIAFAQDGPAPIPLLYVGTAYVAGELSGEVRERDLDRGQQFGNAYEESKFNAETLVRQAAQGGPVVVARPSIVVGASRTGTVRDFKTIYIVLKLLTEGRVQSLPAEYDALLDLVPVDYVVQGICEIARRMDEAAGSTFHLIARRPLTLRDISDVLAEYPSFHVPRFLPPSVFDANALASVERRYYDHVLSLYEPYFRRRTVFLDDGARSFLAARPRASGTVHLRHLLDYSLRVGFLGAPLPAIPDVLRQAHAAAQTALGAS